MKKMMSTCDDARSFCLRSLFSSPLALAFELLLLLLRFPPALPLFSAPTQLFFSTVHTISLSKNSDASKLALEFSSPDFACAQLAIAVEEEGRQKNEIQTMLGSEILCIEATCRATER